MGLERKHKSKQNRREFARKPYNSFLYRWSPIDDITKKKKPRGGGDLFCNAQAGSVDGEDFFTTFVYDKVNQNGTIRKFAYVECGYVE